RETGFFLAAQERQEIALLHLAFESVENPARGGTGDAFAARRNGDGARQLFPDHRAREYRHPAAAILLRHVELPDAKFLGALLDFLDVFRLHCLADTSLPLDRDQLGIDETAQTGLEDAQLFRELEVHGLCPRAAIAPQDAHVDRDGASVGGRDSLWTHDERIDLDFADCRTMVEKKPAE